MKKQQREGGNFLNVLDNDFGDINVYEFSLENSSFSFNQGELKKVPKHFILWDNESTHGTFYNPSLLRNIMLL